MNFLAPVTTSAVLPQSFRHCLQNRHLKRSRLSRLSGNQGYRLTEQLNNVPDAEITGTIQNEKQTIIKQYESYLPTNSWSPGSISKSFSSEKMHSLISDTKICGHLPSHRKQTAFPSTQPRIKRKHLLHLAFRTIQLCRRTDPCDGRRRSLYRIIQHRFLYRYGLSIV